MSKYRGDKDVEVPRRSTAKYRYGCRSTGCRSISVVADRVSCRSRQEGKYQGDADVEDSCDTEQSLDTNLQAMEYVNFLVKWQADKKFRRT